jgi:hypothetical protein
MLQDCVPQLHLGGCGCDLYYLHLLSPREVDDGAKVDCTKDDVGDSGCDANGDCNGGGGDNSYHNSSDDSNGSNKGYSNSYMVGTNSRMATPNHSTNYM